MYISSKHKKCVICNYTWIYLAVARVLSRSKVDCGHKMKPENYSQCLVHPLSVLTSSKRKQRSKFQPHELSKQVLMSLKKRTPYTPASGWWHTMSLSQMSNLRKILHLLLISISKDRSLSRSFCLVIECHWSQRLFGIFAHAAHCGQGTSRSIGYVKPKASHTSRLPYPSASGLAKDNYPKLQPEIPQLTLRQIPENMENGCAAQLKQLAKRNIVQVIKQYRYIQWATCTLGEILFWQWSG